MTTLPLLRIETTRLVVREFELVDGPAVAVVIAAGEWDALPPGAPREPAGVWPWLRVRVHEPRIRGLGLHLAVQARDSGEHVGAMSLMLPGGWTGTAEVGYGIRSGMRNRGYATEALTALTGWAVSTGRLYRVDLLTDPGNTASRRVAERAGYQAVGTAADRLSGAEMAVYRYARPFARGPAQAGVVQAGLAPVGAEQVCAVDGNGGGPGD
jgi:RimJ/RimL family protein N-acetyltransferase